MEDVYIHPSAIIDQDVRIGTGTKVWHFCHVMSGAAIGSNCVLGQNVFVGRGVSIGDTVKIQNNVSVYSGVVVEDEVFLGPSMVFTNVINPRSAIERKEAFQPTHVRHGATIGANATILCGTEIGRFAFVGAGAVVLRTVPDYALVVGNPAKQIGWMSERGVRLEFYDDGRAQCPQDGSMYVLERGRVKKV